mmetsp:Transcript_25929/g.75552  ORF Transcript_25929/g.75552 Transcript_25929/m.75552 type:complete len:213 (+) Transcript_25929:443-1081(+)
MVQMGTRGLEAASKSSILLRSSKATSSPHCRRSQLRLRALRQLRVKRRNAMWLTTGPASSGAKRLVIGSSTMARKNGWTRKRKNPVLQDLATQKKETPPAPQRQARLRTVASRQARRDRKRSARRRAVSTGGWRGTTRQPRPGSTSPECRQMSRSPVPRCSLPLAFLVHQHCSPPGGRTQGALLQVWHPRGGPCHPAAKDKDLPGSVRNAQG